MLPDLNLLRNIRHKSMSYPWDVKILRDSMYVMCTVVNDACMHVLTLEGDMLHSITNFEEWMDVRSTYCFCLDNLYSFAICCIQSHSLRFFSPECNLVYTIGREGHQPRMFYDPTGVAITLNGRLICVSRNENYGPQIFN